MHLRDRIAELVAIPSVSAVRPELDMPNRPVVDKLAGWCESLGFTVEVLPVDARGEKANLVATLGSGPGGLVLAGHTDTVPFDSGQWKSDPFRLTDDGDQLVGLGVCDMKAFFALALEAASSFRASELREPLILVGTSDEESGMDGAKALVRGGKPRARAAVIGEPTSLRPVRAQKGVSMERLYLRGLSGHSSDPANGRSALEGMRLSLDALAEVRAVLQREHRNDAFRPPVPTLNLGRIAGGDNPNRICADCELLFDLRLLPGMDDAVVRETIRRAVERAIAGSGLSMELAPLHEAIPPFETPASAEIVGVVERLTGAPAEAVPFGTEAPFLAELTPEVVVLGPGDIQVAHQPGERLALARLEPCVRILRELVAERCVRR